MTERNDIKEVLIINTPEGAVSEFDDSYIRKNAIQYSISYIPATSAALAATEGIHDRIESPCDVKSLQDYYRES